jgi:hypothetical protein
MHKVASPMPPDAAYADCIKECRQCDSDFMLLRATTRRLSTRFRRIIRSKPSTAAKFAAASILPASPLELLTSRRSYSEMSSSDPTQFVDSAIKKDAIVVFSKSWCPYVFCSRRKKAPLLPRVSHPASCLPPLLQLLRQSKEVVCRYRCEGHSI